MRKTLKSAANVWFLVLLVASFASVNSYANPMDTTLIPARSVWKYDAGVPSVTSTAWTTVAYDDSSWPSGRAGFGY